MIEKTEGISQAALSAMSYVCMKSGLIEERASLLALYYAVGRCGELGFTTMAELGFDMDFRLLKLDWKQRKTMKQQSINIAPHATDWQLDCLHAMFLFFLKTRTVVNNGDEHFVFSSLHGVNDASKKASSPSLLFLVHGCLICPSYIRLELLSKQSTKRCRRRNLNHSKECAP